MYRIAIRFDAGHPRMAGKNGTHQLFTRGAWRVVDFYKASLSSEYPWVATGIGNQKCVWMQYVSRKAPRRGTLINPRRVLASFLAFRREVMTTPIPRSLLKVAA